MARGICGINLNSSLIRRLQHQLGTTSKAIDYVAKVFNGRTYTPEFVNWYTQFGEVPIVRIGNQKRHTINVSDKILADFADKVIQYNRIGTKPDVTDFVDEKIQNDDVKRFGYTSIDNREKAKQHGATMFLDIFKVYRDGNIDVQGDVIEFYMDRIREKVNDIIITRAAKRLGKNKEDVKAEFDDTLAKFNDPDSTETIDMDAYVTELLGEDTSNINLRAFWRELNGSAATRAKITDYIFSDSRLQFFRGNNKDSFDELNERLRLSASYEQGEGGMDIEIADDITPDRSIEAMNGHSGQFRTFTLHLGERLSVYFNSLHKLTTPTKTANGQYVEDTDEAFGLPETMNATEVATTLYRISYKFDTPESTIEAIREVARQIKGYECFSKLADDLENDLDFATEFRTVFIKTVVAKIQAIIDGRKAESKLSNIKTDARDTMYYNLYHDMRSTSIGLDKVTLDLETKQLNGCIFILKRRRDQYSTEELHAIENEAIQHLIRAYKLCFPSIEEAAIISYVELANGAAGANLETELNKISNITDGNEYAKKYLEIKKDVDFRNSDEARRLARLDNLESLATDISTIFDKLDQIKTNYNAVRNAKNDLTKDVRAVDAFGHEATEEEINLAAKTFYEQFLPSVVTDVITHVTNTLLPYSVVQLRLNSPNVMGNNSSDVINNSYITAIKKMFDKTTKNNKGELINPTLIAWGERRLKDSVQFKYSPIFVEQYDKEGKPINKAIFRLDATGALHITEHAESILKTYLFDGASYFDRNTNSTYDKMGLGGYLPSMYLLYFNPHIKYGENEKNFASFFCRTPSDAPKNFVIRMSRYETSGLLIPKDPNYASKVANEVVDNLPILLDGEEKDKYFTKSPATTESTETNKTTVLNNIKGTNKYIRLGSSSSYKKVNDDPNDNTYATRINVTEEGKTKAYVFIGTLNTSSKGNPYLNDTQFIGVYDNEGGTGVHEFVKENVRGWVERTIRNRDITINGQTYNKVKYVVDRTHPLFTLIKNQFKQELLNCAEAIDHYFDTDINGWVKDADEVGDSDVKVIKTKRSNTKGFDFYHKGKDGKVLSTDANGNYRLNGKVFHSNKFTLVKTTRDAEGKEVVDVKNYLDDLIAVGFDQVVEGRPIQLLYGRGNGQEELFLKVNRDSEGHVSDVVLSQTQNDAVDNAIEDFIIDYIDQVGEEIRSKRQFIHNIETNVENITDFAINYWLFYNNSDALFEGDPKFYKDSQTMLKRAKEIQGSGVPYGIVDYLDIDGKEIDDRFNYLNSAEVQERLSKTIANGVKAKRTFKAVTIKNSTMTNEEGLARLRTYLVDKLGMSEQAADDMLYGPRDEEGMRRGGFTEQKVNDAQSYITFAEFVRRIAARGQLKRYMPLIEAISDTSRPLSAERLQEFVQVQKNFYFDHGYSEDYRLFHPRQIKNAEFVLVPRFIEGTELETLNRLMIENGIDQVNTLETSKAANEEALTLWDNNGNLVGEEEFGKRAGELAQEYNYNYLYTQQETQQHLDSTNKAGIQVVKKIVDNIPVGHPLYDRKIEFFNLMVANIRSSYDRLLDKFEVKRDANGNIILEPDGTLAINKTKFYEEFKSELLRLGVNDNIVDYITLENGVPKAPLILNNIVKKLESVSQSIFNNNITRQRLKGFHAAQVTNIGWHSLGTKETISYDKDLEYHPAQYVHKTYKDVKISNRDYQKLLKDNPAAAEEYELSDEPAGYIEIMVSYKALGIDKSSAHYINMSDDEILEELHAKGLDKIVGYRIPTEGKQSTAVMRIVGFLDDGCGSTIVVPNDWVSQTGSDFDIDSIYAIQCEFTKSVTGEIFKVEYNATPKLSDYLHYVNSELGTKKNYSKQVNKTNKDSVTKILDERYEKLQEAESKAYHNLPKEIKDKLKLEHELRVKNSKLSKEENYLELLKTHYDFTNLLLRKYPQLNVAYPQLKVFEDANKKIYDFIINRRDNFAKLLENENEDFANQVLAAAELDAASNGLMNHTEFSQAFKEAPEMFNSGAARGTRICEIMIEILEDPSSLEETLLRSNFDDVTRDKNKVLSKNAKKARDGRSVYNVIDQAKYQEDATSTLALKAVSVSMDTFCSVCNTCQAELNVNIPIVYDSNDFTDIDVAAHYDIKDNNGKTFKINHHQYGWSRTNRNVVGKILTAYSSQTTAHILDAMKEGNIPGVNLYTFNAYKTLLNVGSDFKTAIAFIVQPGIDIINQNNDSNNSVFASSYGNPIHNSIRQLASKIPGINTKSNVPINSVINSVFSKTKPYAAIINRIYGEDVADAISLNLETSDSLPINVPVMMDRINETGVFDSTSPVEGIDAELAKTLFDLSIVIQFNKLNHIANRVGSIARCCNPDKFGAKQTVYATNNIFEDLREEIEQEENNDKYKPILTVNGVSMIKAIYPGIEEGTIENPAAGFAKHDISESAYRTLYAYLKYASATSVIINRELFPTQHMNFVNAVSGFASVLSGVNIRLTEDQYDKMQAFFLMMDYKNVGFIKNPITYGLDENGNLTMSFDETTNGENSAAAIIDKGVRAREAELRRIYGAGFDTGLGITEVEVNDDNVTYKVSDFNVVDPYNPTEEEIKQFAKYSPAQKVDWIKSNFKDSGVFKNYTVTLYNDSSRGRKANTHTIEFNESAIDTNVMFYLFKQAFYSKHPFIKMAAIDCIKYAVATEGLIMSQNGISKTIPNQPLLDDIEDGGTGFVSEAAALINGVGNKSSNYVDHEYVTKVYELYLRSNPGLKGVRTFYMNVENARKYKIRHPFSEQNGKDNNVLVFFPDAETKDKLKEEQYADWRELMTSAGIMAKHEFYDYWTFNDYIYVKEKDKTTLYKIVPLRSRDGVVLYPLNELLPGENTEFSIKDSLNIYPRHEYYDQLVSLYDNNLNFVTLQESKSSYMYKKGNTNVSKINVNLEQLANSSSKVGLQIAYQTMLSRFNNGEQMYYSANKALRDLCGNKTLTSKLTLDNKAIINVEVVPCKAKLINNLLNQAYDRPERPSKEQFKKALSNALNKEYNTVNKDLLQIGLDAYSSGTHVDNLMNVREVNTSNLASAYEDTSESNIAYINTNAHNADPNARITRYRLKALDLQQSELSDATKESLTRELASYAHTKAKELRAAFYSITDDPLIDGNKVSMMDDVVFDILTSKVDPVNDDTKRDIERRFIKTALEIRGFIKEFAPWEHADVSDQPEAVQQLVTDIKETLKTVNSIPVDDAIHKFNERYISKLSTNPLVVDQTISIMDNYWKTYGNMWQFTDVAESGNPLVQVIYKTVMADVEARIAHGRREKIKLFEEIERIKQEAKAHGQDVNMDHIIDEHGVARQNYSSKLVEDVSEKYGDMENARIMYGRGSIEHLRAKVEYDKLKAKYFNQPAKQEYYLKKVEREERILNMFPEIYSAYMKLFYDRLDILQHGTADTRSEEDIKKLDELDSKIKALYSEYVILSDGRRVERPEYNPNSTAPNHRIIADRPAEVLRLFLEHQKTDDDIYFKYDPAYGFEKQLEINLNIIYDAEQRNVNGIPSRTPIELAGNEKYQEAKAWLRRNARFEVTASEEALQNPDSIVHKIIGAIKRLSLASNGRHTKTVDLAKKKNAFDEFRVIDGTKFTEDERKELKKSQEGNYGVAGMPAGTDTILISSATKDTNVYKPTFYDGLKLNGGNNAEYIKVVNDLNHILAKYYDNNDGIVHFEQIPDTQEGIAELNRIAELYKKLSELHKRGGSNKAAVRDFINKNVDNEPDAREKQIFSSQFTLAHMNSQEYIDAWNKCNFEYDEEGNLKTDREGKAMPNRRLYYGFRPKPDKIDKFKDDQRKEDFDIMANYFRKVPTVYWSIALREANRRADADPTFDRRAWLADNMLWNPRTKRMELLDCWLQSEPVEELFAGKEYEARWVPRSAQRMKVPKDGMIEVNGQEFYVEEQDKRNHDYKEGSMWNNYINDPNSEYANTTPINDYEKQIRDLILDALSKTAYTPYAKEYFGKGYMPVRMKNIDTNARRYLKEVEKSFGLRVGKDKENKEFFDELSYERDIIPAMPMMQLLRSKDMGSEIFTEPEPKRGDFADTVEGLREYNNKLIEWKQRRREHNDKQRKIHEDLLDRNWLSVLEEYLDRANRYNAVMDNRDRLYFLLDSIKRQKAYSRQHGLYGNLKRDSRNNVLSDDKYAMSTDEELVKQVSTFMRRLLYDQWKQDDGKITSAMQGLQIFTSANYMMLNYRGGFANVTVGEMSVLAEVAAGQYIDGKAWGFGTGHWLTNCLSFIRGAYTETADSKEDAIVKYFKVVDYDSVTGVEHILDIEKYSKRLRDFMFHPQTIGEHFMQNSVLFAMLKTHKIVSIDEDPKGIGAAIMNFGDYMNYYAAKDLETILTDEQKRRFKAFKESIQKDKNKTKDYAWWRKDVVTEFMALHCDATQRKKYRELREQNLARRKNEFDNMQDMWSQVELGSNGYMKFSDNTPLGELDMKYLVGDKVTAAEALCGEMTERVRKVNNKIHGVYNKIGQAWIEGKWYGGLVMQYHKHLPMGILKHYRSRGYYNETRGTAEKGMLQSITDLLSLNVRKVNYDKLREQNAYDAESFGPLTEDNKQAIEALQFHLGSAVDYLLQIRDTYNLLPETERANIRRNLGDLVGTVSGVALVIALLAFGGGADDDDNSGFLNTVYHFSLYEADRLASEVFLYNPIGLWTETKTLMSTPIAAQSIVSDALSSIGNICKFLVNPNSEDLYYQTGRFAGRNKLWVYAERRIPIWNGIRGILDTPSNNRYYKRGKTVVSIVPTKEIAEGIRNTLGLD